jgi:capsular polysaccharide biosynthesis protein
MSCHDVPAEHIGLLRDLFEISDGSPSYGLLIDRRPLVRRWRIMKQRYAHVARGLLNHDRLFHALRKRFRELEWRVFTPEMGVGEMLSLFRNARIVVGPHGAGFANLLFSPQRTGVLEICPSGSSLTFAILSQLMGHHHRCLAVGDSVSTEEKRQPCEAPIEETLETAARILRATGS